VRRYLIVPTGGFAPVAANERGGAAELMPQDPSPTAVTNGSPRRDAPHVMVVDDDPTVLRTLARTLRGLGYEVTAVSAAPDAVQQVRDGKEFDAILSDISMPSMDGIQLLREIREHDLHVPVVLITGEPAVSTAVKAVEYGAFRYLTKPTSTEEIHRVLSRAAAMTRMARVKEEAATVLGAVGVQAADRAGLEASFERALHSLWMAYQPIVSSTDYQTYAFEALIRCDDPALPGPGPVISAAERLGRLPDLGRVVRDRVAGSVDGAGVGRFLFVNCHPSDLLDENLYLAEAPLSRVATRVVLEITERAGLEEIGDVRSRVARLREMGFRIALDDFGAGYAGLTSFAQLEPEIVKMDLSIVRDVERSAIKQKLIRSVTTLAKDMGILVVAEGVETTEERDALTELGIDLFQGYLFARPGKPFPAVSIPPPSQAGGMG
jgi:EAL domain-containing protein (putative c-di-GMP-specific phosphodiesterase class I)/CheY-like chemotaxis protein